MYMYARLIMFLIQLYGCHMLNKEDCVHRMLMVTMENGPVERSSTNVRVEQ